MKNLFIYFLQLLGVKHTKKYAERVYNEHPYKNSLFAFSDLLHKYGVNNVTVQLLEEDKNITKLDAPVIVSLGHDIANVSKIEEEFITLSTLNNHNVKITLTQLAETGI